MSGMEDKRLARALEAPEAGEERVIEPEIVGHEDRPPLWRRLLAGLAVRAALAVLGLGLAAIGGLLTLSILGAPVGIPLLAAGLLLMILAFLLPLGGGKVRFISFRL